MSDSVSISHGRYTLLRLLGEGGMAKVFLAQDSKLDVERAIKVLTPKLASDLSYRQRLLSEAKVMAKLIHPNIVTVHDVVDEEAPFIVMEYLKGGNLNELIKEHGALSIGQAAQVMIPICQALHTAHEMGVVHLDIKPQNILLTQKNEPKLTDFGIARVLSSTGQTQTGIWAGTPSYMAPEQRLSLKKVSHLSDVYALGATLFVLMTGQNPDEMYEPETQETLLCNLPENIRAFLKACCAFNSSSRPQSALEIARFLEPYLSDDTETLPTVTPRNLGSEHEDVSLAHVWHSLTEAFSKETVKPKPLLNLEIEQDTLDQDRFEEKSATGEPVSQTNSVVPDVSNDSGENNLDSPPVTERHASPQMDASAPALTVSEQPISQPSSTDQILPSTPAKTDIDSSNKPKWLVFGVGIFSALLIGLSIVMPNPQRLVIPLYILGVGGLGAVFSGLLLGKPLIKARRWGAELAHSLTAVLVMVSVGAFVSAPLLLEMSFFETDFIDYCVGIAHFDNALLAPPKRANGAAWLPATLARSFGVIDGLAYASLISCGLIGLGMQLWARAIGGPIAGYFAIAIALGLAPIVGMSRFLNFYPEIIATFTLAGGLTALAIRTRHVGSILPAAALTCCCVLVDLRGVIWFLAFSAGLILAVLGMSTWKDRFNTICGLIAIYAVAWKLGKWSYHELATPLERQIDVRPLFAAFDPQKFPPPYNTPSEFVWGRTAISELPQTLSFLFEQRTIRPPDAFLSVDTGMTILAPYAQGWMLCLSLCVLLSMVFYSQKRWHLAAILIPLAPFAVALLGAQELVEPHLRFFAHALPGIVVLVAVLMAALTRQVQCSFKSSTQKQGLRRFMVLIPLVLICGLVLKPLVDWHPRWPIQRHIYRSALEKAFPERAGFFRTLSVSVGVENHVHVLPLSQAERALAQDYDVECATRLREDKVLMPSLYGQNTP